MKRFWTGLLTLVVLAGIGFAVWWFVAGGNNSNNTTNTGNNSNTSQLAADKEQIRTNWIKFFDGKTSAQDKINLLQNGQQFAQTIQAQASSQTAKSTTVAVSKVDVNGTTAAVTYTIYLNGKPTLSNQQGQAVKENGTWKVSDTAFCSLLQLSGTVPPNCPKTGNQQTQTQGQTNTNTQTQSGTSSGTGTGTGTQSGTTAPTTNQ